MYDAIVLAGGAATRLGGADKPALEVRGATLLSHVLRAVRDAAQVVVVGPRRPTAGSHPGAVVWCQEDPPGGGPVAALAAAVPATSSGTVVVLAADLPFVAPAVPPLLAAVSQPAHGCAAAFLVDVSGRTNYLAGAWRRAELAAALARLGPPEDASMHALLTGLDWVAVPDPQGWGHDCDTWDDVAAARAAGPAAGAR